MGKTKVLEADTLNTKGFIEEKAREISDAVGKGTAINALSGGVDSSVATMLGHRAIGDRLLTYLIDNGLMRKDETEWIVDIFKQLGVKVEVVDAGSKFFKALKGMIDPEEKREAITQTFYKDVFGKLVKQSRANILIQGTILTDIDETVAGIKRQHNVFEQLGIDPQKTFGYKILEPLVQLRKDGVRKVGRALQLPRSLLARIPFPGPALATRVIGEVTPQRVETVRLATSIVEEELAEVKAFQYMAILHEDRVTGTREGKRDFGYQIELRCWDSADARVAIPTRLSFPKLRKIADRLCAQVPGVVSVTYNIASKPPSTIEAI